MKINKNISRYIIDQNGDVFERSTGVKVDKINKEQVKLVTDEIFTSSITGKKSNIVRRFTKEQITKLWQDKESLSIEDFEKSFKKPHKENPVFEEAIASVADPSGKVFKIEVNGVKYENASQAGKHLGVSSTTINNRIKKGAEGYKSL